MGSRGRYCEMFICSANENVDHLTSVRTSFHELPSRCNNFNLGSSNKKNNEN